ncbi:MAG TPA: phosphate acetyltransferase [Halanaerobiales bacterium]|nr:phosphate acetyltransferase [Halanaerobiales bacterium]
MDLLTAIKKKAKSEIKKIVFPEGTEPRIIKAAAKILKENLAEIILLGKEEEIKSIAQSEEVNINNAYFINPDSSELLEKYTDIFYKLRKHKGISKEDASSQVVNPLYFGTMLVHSKDADGMVAGSITATPDVLRPAFQIVKTKKDISIVSGAFLMEVPDCEYGANGSFIFADCAVNPVPDSAQLAEIAISSAETARTLLGVNPVVALLSFSTKGSTSHERVQKVIDATEIVNKKEAELIADGELQADAALVKNIACKKCPNSKAAGSANVLIFPDLQSGNIAYKLVQRLAKANAIGPILQGIAKPINDLSRGCSVEDIVNIAAITAVQAQVLE